ncbi:MAG: tRNA glutamyl-Q(34) synthetase GluQRS [Gammaproteobacteria bacterium]|nr:tRNA glutamyl-Q(34) synthetase GluQRS [Gammaproteobacteria bacterium]
MTEESAPHTPAPRFKAQPIAPYRGRFAPSPTGPLHFGSLVAATGSFLQARSGGGEWLVRIEDLDPPRTVAGAADCILRTLEEFGLTWDGVASYQSRREAAYRDALARLQDLGAVYGCSCTRSEIADSSVRGIDGPVYPGTCRDARRTGRTLRVLTEDCELVFRDLVQGEVRCALAREIGDFVVRRADGLHAYQLAAAVDDAEQGITEVVRGADLLYSTPRQIHLQKLLGLPTPGYAHLPLATDCCGRKLSKQTGAAAVGGDDPVPVLIEVLRFLGQQVPEALRDSDLTGFWRWAIEHWQVQRVPRQAPAVTGQANTDRR